MSQEIFWKRTINLMFAENEDDGDGEWCEVEISLTPNHEGGCLRLSITGSSGEILSVERAKEQAISLWEGLIEVNAAERMRLCDMAERYMTSRQAAEYVVSMDGEYHGLDVHHVEGDKVYILTSCGQIRDEIAKYFPEVIPYFKWHLNDMHSECIHQEARNETKLDLVCPDCGWKCGHGWNYRELPEDVIAWAKGDE